MAVPAAALPAHVDPGRAQLQSRLVDTVQSKIDELKARRNDLLAEGKTSEAQRVDTRVREQETLLARQKAEFQNVVGISYDDYQKTISTPSGGCSNGVCPSRPAGTTGADPLNAYLVRTNSPADVTASARQQKSANVALDGNAMRITERNGAIFDSQGYTYYQADTNGNIIFANGGYMPIKTLQDAGNGLTIGSSTIVYRAKPIGTKDSGLAIIEKIQGGATEKDDQGNRVGQIININNPQERITLQSERITHLQTITTGKRVEFDGDGLRAYTNPEDTIPDVIARQENSQTRIQVFDAAGNINIEDVYSNDGKTIRTIIYKSQEFTVNGEKVTKHVPDSIVENVIVGTRQENGKAVNDVVYRDIIPELDAQGNPTGRVTVYTRDRSGRTTDVQQGTVNIEEGENGKNIGTDLDIGDTDKEALESIQRQEKVRNFFQGMDFTLTGFQGFSGYSQLFLRRQLAPWREKVDSFFASTYLGSQYWASSICSKYSDDAGENVAFFETPRGVVTIGAHIEAERSEEILAYDTVFGAPQVQYFYKITYAVENPPKYRIDRSKEEELTFNVHLKGSRDIYLYNRSVKVKEGESFRRAGSSAIVQYSSNLYTEVCIEFEDEVRTLGGVYIDEVCNEITETTRAPSGYEAPQRGTGSRGSSGGTSQGPITEVQI